MNDERWRHRVCFTVFFDFSETHFETHFDVCCCQRCHLLAIVASTITPLSYPASLATHKLQRYPGIDLIRFVGTISLNSNLLGRPLHELRSLVNVAVIWTPSPPVSLFFTTAGIADHRSTYSLSIPTGKPVK